MKRLKSTSKYGQSLKSRAKESKGSRKKELMKMNKADKMDYAKAPKKVKKMIKNDYSKRISGITTKNDGMYI